MLVNCWVLNGCLCSFLVSDSFVLLILFNLSAARKFKKKNKNKKRKERDEGIFQITSFISGFHDNSVGVKFFLKLMLNSHVYLTRC